MAEERPVKDDANDAAALLQNLRRSIDELDELLVRTLSARAACALEIGRQKKRLGLEIYQPSREADVLALHGMGPNAMSKLRAALKAAGLGFARRAA